MGYFVGNPGGNDAVGDVLKCREVAYVTRVQQDWNQMLNQDQTLGSCPFIITRLLVRGLTLFLFR